MRRSLLGIFLLLGTIAVGFGVVASQTRETPFAWVGARMQEAQLRDDADRVVAIVNDEPITVQEVLDRLTLLGGNAILEGKEAEDVDVADAFGILVKGKVQIAEAKRRGIQVSAEEIASYIKTMREQMAEASPEDRRPFDEELIGRGLSEEEFWKQEAYRYETVIMTEKLFWQFAEENELAEVEFSEVQKAYGEFVQKLEAAASIEILVEDFGL